MTLLVIVVLLILGGIVAFGLWAGELGGALVVAFVAALVLAFPVATYAHAHHDERVMTCTVTDKDRGGDDGSYRIYTDECGQLSNNDSVWRGKYDSADVWQQIEPGNTYRLTVVGWRMGFLSTFPNVLKVEDGA